MSLDELAGDARGEVMGFWQRQPLRIGLLLLIIGVAAPWARAHSGDEAYVELLCLEDLPAGARDPLDRLAHIVGRASTLVSTRGDTLLPPGTRLARSAREGGLIAVWLDAPATAGSTELSETRVMSITDVLSLAFADDSSVSKVRVQLRIGEGAYRPLSSYIPSSSPLPPEGDVRESPAMLEADKPAAKTQAGFPAEPGPQSIGGPLANADGQPTGALSGVVIFCNAGHGWTNFPAVSSLPDRWALQRPLLLSMVEDYGNLDQLNLFAQYCYNAGAVVVPFRPVSFQSTEIVLDNDDPGVTYTGSWSNSSATIEYYENGATNSGIPYRFATAAGSQTATARYTPTIPSADFYPVYCWTRDGTDRVTQTYRIAHSGGIASVRIDHRRVGKGWIWLGTFYFEAGTGGHVEITNQSTDSGVVIADAIRLGNGMGDVPGTHTNTISGFPRDEEAARYWAHSELSINAVGNPSSIWNCCTVDSDDNVGTAARWSAFMNRTNVNNDRWRRVYLEFHTNAGSGSSRGTLGLYNGTNDTQNQFAYATIIGEKVEADMAALNSQFEFPWAVIQPNTLDRSDIEFGAISGTATGDEFDATILEVAYHDNTQDAANLRNLKVRDAVARSSMQSIINFLNSLPGSQVPLTYPPEAPETVRATHNGAGQIVVSWTVPPSTPPSGHAPAGYKIYRSSNGYGFGQGVDVGNVTTTAINDISAGVTTYLRVSAYNAGGESMPSETLAIRRPAADSAQVLIVNGFDRVGRTLNPIQQIPAGPMERQIPRRVNSFDYIIQHAAALSAAGVTFDSASNEAVIAGTAPLTGYGAVAWILGRESTADDTFNATEQSLVTSYLNAGGRIFLTGTEIGWDLDSQGGGVSFFRNTLKAAYVGDDAGTFTATGNGGCLMDLGNLTFSTASGAPYVASFPDRLAPQSGAISIMSYVGGTGGTAGIQYDSGLYRVVMLGFPLECIGSEVIRADVMARVMEFLLQASPSVQADFDNDDDVDMVDFAHLQSCYTSALVPLTPECQNANFDGDSDVDVFDFATFVECLTGSDIGPDPSCENG